MKPRFVLIVFLSTPLVFAATKKIKTGDDVFVESYLDIIKGKTIGIITNQTGVLSNGRHIVDVLVKIPNVKVKAIFTPEHGIRGQEPAGASVSDQIDEKTGIRVYSLYGKTLKPTRQMLRGIDVLIYDIQDVGARFYTYISTLDLTLEAAAENHIKYIVLDRPDMLRADMVDGPVLVDSEKSFVGIQPLPSVYGMTPGEVATMINQSGWLRRGEKADLTVIKMENYRRSMWYDQTGLRWISPSPNLPNMESVEVYPGCVLIEATNVSEGRGTEKPFQYIGAPFINGERLAKLLNAQQIAGAQFMPIDFVPRPSLSASSPKWENQLCHGIKILVTNRNKFRPVEVGIHIIWAINQLYHDSLEVRSEVFDKLAGTPQIRLQLQNGANPHEIISSWKDGTKNFMSLRSKFLFYR
jgi:uncharacterized protein YbbC (DUF1343 family)